MSRELPSTDTNALSDKCGDSNSQGKQVQFYLHLNQFALAFTPSNINSPYNDTENDCANDFVDWREVACLKPAA